MPLTLEQVLEIKGPLEDTYRDRHEAFRRLRLFWHGRYWDDATQEANSVAMLFRDLYAPQRDVGPDVKLVHNILQEVCVKFQTFLSPLPMIRVFVDPPESDKRRQQATLKERALYGLWSEGNMAQVLNKCAWYLPLMGDVFHGIFPDFDKKIPVPIIRSPEIAFPVPSYDTQGMDATIFAWKARESQLKRAYPNFSPHEAGMLQRMRGVFASRSREADPEYEVVEYCDSREWGRWIGDQQVNGVVHDYGFNLFEQMQFIHVPGEVWGHGAVEQFVELTEANNAVLSLLFQAVVDNVFPKLVLEDASKAPEEIDQGPGAVLPLNPGGRAYYLGAPINMQAGAGMSQELERTIKQGTHMPDASFGVANNSVITGKAINELQGAGTGSVVEMVQGVGIGTGLVAWNEKALYMLQTTFKDDQILLHGTRPLSSMDLVPSKFGLRFRGSQIIGSPRNEVVFSPNMDAQTKLVMGLQAMGGGLVSKKWNRENIGIPDSEAMEEEIFGETVNDAVLGLIVQQIQSPDLGTAEQAESQGNAVLEGVPLQMVAPHPLLAAHPVGSAGPAGPSSGGGAPSPFGNLPGGGQTVAPPLALPAGSPLPQAGQPPAPAAAAASGGGGGTTTAQDALQALGQVQLSGQAWLVGEIVAKGSTDGPVDIAVTSPDDRQPLADAARQAGFVVQFTHVAGQPAEPAILIGGDGQVLQPAEAQAA